MRIPLPWWAKIAAKLVLSRLPFGYSLWQRLGLFRHGCMDTSDYAICVFDSHVERSAMKGRLAGVTVLELGPGDSVASAIVAAANGARAVLVDSGSFVRRDLGPYVQLERSLVARGLVPPAVADCRDLEQVLERCGARYLTRGLESLKEVESESVDLIFSQAVLEHVRKKDFLATLRECRRILRRDGICSHQVDLRDHLGGALNNLRFSERLWESEFFSSSGFYTNRVRFSEMPVLFQQAGFDVQITSVRRWPALPTPRKSLDRQFRGLPDDELCVSGFEVLLR